MPGVTLNPPTLVTGIAFVVTVTSRGPIVAPDAMLMVAVRLVALPALIEVTVIPGPELTRARPEVGVRSRDRNNQ